ncbi:MAG: lysine--tRNA ligase [bacterium]|nr:lysine--tRNA ligase [bacterium]
MIKINEREDRLKKLAALKELGINPYPAKAEKTDSVDKVLADFESLQKDGKELKLAGRLRSLRAHGNLTFAHLEDGSGKIQLAFSKKAIGAESYKTFSKYIDIGDFAQVSGTAFLTHNGEKSLMVKNWKLLTKALRPLPDKWHGIEDEEDKLRKRYLDILFNPEVKEIFIKRAKFWQAMRDFMINRGFLEVETPVLENTAGGADARPFITHHNALDMDVYLRISMGELWQKRLMVAGFEKTFEIGRQFRNEGISPEHSQDYTQMEFYWAYADYEMGMKLAKEMYRYVAQETFNTLKFKIRNFEVDLAKDWEVYDFQKLVKKMTGVDPLKTTAAEIEKKLNELKIKYDKKGFNLARGIDNLWKYCRKSIGGPGFLINVPVIMEPLAKRSANNPEVVERFQVIIAGSEVGKGYSELNDPEDQAERFVKQQELREAGDEEAQMYDQDFVEALEYGMPPTCGFGVSERLFSFLMNKPARECQIFPLMKPRNK